MNEKYEDYEGDLPEYVDKDNFPLYAMRHSAEHVLTQAMHRLYGEKKVLAAMGPATKDGFYFDFDARQDVSITIEEFKKIEREMYKIVEEDQRFERREIPLEEARRLFVDNPYKQEWIDVIRSTDGKATVYVNVDKDGNETFVDLCKGPHVDNTGQIGKFKLISIAGAYWRGDVNNKMLTRIYGTTFKTKEELDKYMEILEELKKRDHKKLGKDLDLFFFSELVGGGLPLWTPKGTILREELDNYIWELRKEKGYQKVTIPHITKKKLYEISGHWEKFEDELFKINSREGHFFAMKPMNCPHHTQIYNHLKRSYRDLPQRYAETTMVYRDEQSGELAGLSRVRCITQDDAHVFCRYSQVKEEFFAIWDIVDEFYSAFGFDLTVSLSFHDPNNLEKYLGTEEIWQEAEKALEEIAKERGVEYRVNIGEAAFYGPKIDFIAKDSMEREWQVATIQLDMNLPERFDLTCVNEKGKEERIVMIHPAIMGSIERFASVMIEHFAGAFPAWLSPEQVALIPIGEDNHDYAERLEKELKEVGVRVLNDKRDEQMQAKIRDAQNLKIPYMLILGKREEEEGNASIRYRDKKENEVMKFDEFKDKIVKNIGERKLEIQL